ncbi:MAG: STAS/SEC14 domain-containing protein [Octadecabacter sp.]|nr:STAS/SEC14 domain-containing protein [Octadecabacter sp.]
MLKIQKTAPNRVDIELSGPLDAEMMREGLDELIQASEGIEGGGLLYRIPAFVMPTFGAIMVEMGRLPDLFGLVGKFDKCAVLTDAAWLQTTAEVEGWMIPGLKIKTFDMAHAEAAEAWLADNAAEDADDGDEDNDLGDNMPV